MSPDTHMAGAELEFAKQVLAHFGYGPESFADIYEGRRAVTKNKLSGQL